MKFYRIFLSAACLLIMVSCKAQREGQKKVLVTGISGRVILSQGNMMPGPGVRSKSANGVKREIVVYAVAKTSDVEGEGPLYSSVNTPLIAKVSTDASGYYKCGLQPGTYSVFTRENGGKLFSSVSSEKGEIGGVIVTAGQVSTYNINVNYQAVY